MSWYEAAVSVVSAVAGGFMGGWVVAFRMGRWRQRVEDHLENIERRLASGDRTLYNVPIIDTRLEALVEELKALRTERREDVRRFVTHEECDRRHGTDSNEADSACLQSN